MPSAVREPYCTSACRTGRTQTALRRSAARQGDRRLVLAQRLQAGKQAAGLGRRVAGADPAGIAQRTVLLDSATSSAPSPPAAADSAKPTIRNSSLCRHLVLSQVLVRAGAVVGVDPLGDHAFQPHARGLRQEIGPMALDVAAELERRGRTRDRREQRVERLLARQQRHLGEIVAIEMQEVEREEGELVRAAFGERILQRRETG